jgi:hypothetical protein
MPKGARGEAIINVDGRRYEVLFTNRALAEAEALTGKTVVQLLDRAAIGVTDLAHLLVAGLEAARRESEPSRARYGPEDAWAIIDAAGFFPALQAVVKSLVAVVTYAAGDKGEPPDPPA